MADQTMTLHDFNPDRKVYVDADDLSTVVPSLGGSYIILKQSGITIAVKETPEEVMEVKRKTKE